MGKKRRKNLEKNTGESKADKKEKNLKNISQKAAKKKGEISQIFRPKKRKIKENNKGKTHRKCGEEKIKNQGRRVNHNASRPKPPLNRLLVQILVKNGLGNSLKKSLFLAKKFEFDLNFPQKRKRNLKIIENFSIFLKF